MKLYALKSRGLISKLFILFLASNVFPIIPATGRQLEGQEFNLIRTAETVMKAINLWDRKNIEDTEKED